MNINRQITPYNHTQGRYLYPESHSAPQAIDKIILHTIVGTLASAQARFFGANGGASATYGIGLNGEIRQWVSEGDTSWNAGNWAANTQSISIEHEDNGNYNDGTRTDALYDSSIALCVDICRRYGLGANNIHIHKEFKNTGCPDGLDIDRIRNGVAAILASGVVAPAPEPGIGYTPTTGRVMVTTSVMMVRTGPGRNFQSGVANTTDGAVHYGVPLNITGYTTQGEVVNAGNPVWLRSAQGNWFYSGCTDFNWPSVLPTPAPAAPAIPTYDFVAQPTQIVCSSGAGVNLRKAPGLTADIVSAIADGSLLDASGYVTNGESVNGDTRWWKVGDSVYVSNAVITIQPAAPVAPTTAPEVEIVRPTPETVATPETVSETATVPFTVSDAAPKVSDLAPVTTNAVDSIQPKEASWDSYKKEVLTNRQRLVAIIAAIEGFVISIINVKRKR